MWVVSCRDGRLRPGTKRMIWGPPVPPPMNRGALTHDDRLDALAGAVVHFQRAMMMDGRPGGQGHAGGGDQR
jgi:hypothetical protein